MKLDGDNTKSFGIGTFACYQDFDQVGEGTYGYVYKAKDRRTNEPVALKRLIFHRESSGFPLCAVREIKFLKSLQHKNIVQLKDVITARGCENLEVPLKADTPKNDESGDLSEQRRRYEQQERENQSKEVMRICGSLYLVFEFVEHDLGGLIDAKVKFPVRAVKCIMKQLFEVLDFLADRRVMHRDIKSSNILISNRHHIKLADFGLARSTHGSDGRELRVDMTNNVITMWYKPPELLLGAVRYGSAIDMWSAGCVLAELELGRPLFPGKTEVEQLDLICRALGTPGEEVWPGMAQMPHYESLLGALPKYGGSLRNSYSSKLSEAALSLLERVLVVDPARRSSAKIALTNKYFSTAPLPPLEPGDLEPLNVASGVNYHEYKTKQARRQRELDEVRQLAKQQSEAAAALELLTATSGSNAVSAAAPAGPNPFTAAPVAAIARPPHPPQPPAPTSSAAVPAGYGGVVQHSGAALGYGGAAIVPPYQQPPLDYSAQQQFTHLRYQPQLQQQPYGQSYPYNPPVTHGYGAALAPPPLHQQYNVPGAAWPSQPSQHMPRPLGQQHVLPYQHNHHQQAAPRGAPQPSHHDHKRPRY